VKLSEGFVTGALGLWWPELRDGGSGWTGRVNQTAVHLKTNCGATDEFGYEAVENVASAYAFHATIPHLLGLDHGRLSFYHNGIDRCLTDMHGHVIKESLA
jgi:hypothetical protein